LKKKTNNETQNNVVVMMCETKKNETNIKHVLAANLGLSTSKQKIVQIILFLGLQ
jgi:hypothetical protein